MLVRRMQGLQRVQAAMAACSTSEDAPLVAYVSKMIAVPASALPRMPGVYRNFPLASSCRTQGKPPD
jgi:ribosome assembly protein 1